MSHLFAILANVALGLIFLCLGPLLVKQPQKVLGWIESNRDKSLLLKFLDPPSWVNGSSPWQWRIRRFGVFMILVGLFLILVPFVGRLAH
ncbi:MAG TPA: hypothetical protein VNV60_11135 [Holophagaceae bacterium]|jgi:hypothetical protein|nr:hypothetical protein [Holophagaceae bacterium]